MMMDGIEKHVIRCSTEYIFDGGHSCRRSQYFSCCKPASSVPVDRTCHTASLNAARRDASRYSIYVLAYLDDQFAAAASLTSSI